MPLLLPQTVIMLQFCNFVASFTAEPQSLTLSDMLAVETVSKVESCPAATARWLEPSLPHSLISVYPLVQIPTPANGGILYCRTFVSSYENGSCCWNQPLLSPTASQKRNHPLSLLQILQYFSFCSLDYFTRWKSIEIKDSLLEVGESFVSPKVMRCLPRCDHDSCCFFAHKAVPGQGTKLSINFEPFLVLDQRTT